MTGTPTSKAAKKLVVQFLLDNVDFRKRSLYLQEIIRMSRTNDVWRKALMAFFDTPAEYFPEAAFCKN